MRSRRAPGRRPTYPSGIATRSRALVLACLVGTGVPGIWIARTHSELVRSSERADAAWAQVANVLQRRADLIPNLLAVTRAAAVHERALLVELARAEAACAAAQTSAERIACAHGLDLALGSARAAGERNAALGATRAYANLRFELEGSENRIAIERLRYNAAVREYHLLLHRFPSRAVARLFGFSERPYY